MPKKGHACKITRSIWEHQIDRSGNACPLVDNNQNTKHRGQRNNTKKLQGKETQAVFETRPMRLRPASQQ